MERVFPNEQSCLRLVFAPLMETNREWMERMYCTWRKHNRPQVKRQESARWGDGTRNRSRLITKALRATPCALRPSAIRNR